MKQPGVATLESETWPGARTPDRGASEVSEAMSTTQNAGKTLPDTSDEPTGKYGIPKRTLARAKDHLGFNPVARRDLSDSLIHWKTEYQIDQEQLVPDDPVGRWKDVETGRIVEVGEHPELGWYVTRDAETHEPDVIEPGRVIPAITNRRLIPVEAGR